MSKLSAVLREAENNTLIFHCPGCGYAHSIQYGKGKWSWDGNKDKPTFNPSILVKATKLTEQGEIDFTEWQKADYPARETAFESIPTICHSFVIFGRIQFLNDCTHSLAGQTVDLPNIDY